jgi:hypothetical protein
VSKVSPLCWIKRTHNTLVGQVICWIRIDCHIRQVLIFVGILTIHLKSTISGVTPYPLTSMATIRSASTTVVVVKSEDLEHINIERQLIRYQ